MKILVLFDVDGTLIHSEKNDSRSFAETYEELYGLPFPTIDWLRYEHVTDTTILQSVLGEHFERECNWEEVEVFQENYIARMARKRAFDAKPYREVPYPRATIERLLADPRFVVAIATGGWRDSALFKLHYLDFPVEAIPVVGADHKYTREAILEEAVGLVRQTMPDISRIVYIGDALWDVRTTRQLDMSFVGIRVRGDVELLLREGVQHVFTDFSDYGRFLEAVALAGPPGFPEGETPGYEVF